MPNLTFKQKRDYQAQIDGKYAEMEAGTLSFKEKRTIQAQINDIYTLLGEDGTTPTAAPTLFDRMLAGEFNSLPMQQYIDKWREVNKDFDNSTLADLEDKITNAMSEYMAAHRSEITNPAGLNITQQDLDEAA